MIDNSGYRVFVFCVGIPSEEVPKVVPLVHFLPNLHQVHGEKRRGLVRLGPLDGEVYGDKEGEAPIQETGRGAMVAHEGEPADPVPLWRFRGQIEVSFPTKASDQPFLDLRHFRPISLPAVDGGSLQTGFEGSGAATVTSETPPPGLELLVTIQEFPPTVDGFRHPFSSQEPSN
jgi:hypothetical protein